MTESLIPTPSGDYSAKDFETSTDRARKARQEFYSDDPERQEALTAAYSEIIARTVTLSTIRKSVGLTQQQMAANLGCSQAEVSRLERRGNLHLETLCRFIDAAGGRVRVIAEMPQCPPVEIGFGDLLPGEHSSEPV